MPEFRYKAVTASAETIAGRMEAADQATLVDRLHALGHVPLNIEPIAPSHLAALFARELLPARRMTPRSLALITGQLATLLRAGLALDQALSILEELVDRDFEKTCVRRLTERISAGSTIADAMSAQQDVFPEYCVNMVRAGEAGANLEPVLESLSVFIERAQANKEHVKSALLYPAIVALACCVSIAILLLFVAPRFRPLFEQSGVQLPASAQFLMSLSELLTRYWWIGLPAVLLGVLFGYLQARKPTVRLRWQRRALRVPLVGELVRKIAVARFCRTLGALLKNGVPLLAALAITRDTMSDTVLAEPVGAIIERVRTGRGLAEPLRETHAFPRLAEHLVHIGEESGRQDEMLDKIADIFEAETHRAIDRLLALIAPVVTIVLGVIVAGVIMSMMKALLSVYDVTM